MGCKDFPHHRAVIILISPNRFRWVFCQLEALRHCLPSSVRQMLGELPETLDETYERVLREINKAKREHAHRLLQCLTVAVRPLRVAELAEVLAVDFGPGTASGGETSKLNTDWRWDDQEQAVLSTCSSLIAVVDDGDGDQVVQFSHFSVKEFLTSPRLADSSTDVSRFYIFLEPAHVILARACLGTLLQLDNRVDKDNVEVFSPLARYAAEHWAKHAQFEGVASQLREGMEILFDPNKPYFSAWTQVYNVDDERHTGAYFQFSPTEPSAAAPLYYAALLGFRGLAEHLIHNDSQQVNACGGRWVSPLAAALYMGHFKMAELLYQRGADVLVRGLYQRTLLHAMSTDKLIKSVQWLLSHDVDPNVRQDDGWTCLHLAACNGRLEVVRMLLQHNADINARDEDGRLPLHRASEEGHSEVARLLLDRGVDVNARDKNGFTPLHLASKGPSWPRSMKGSLEIARLLIEHGADVCVEDNKGNTPSQVARGTDVKKLLSDHGSK